MHKPSARATLTFLFLTAFSLTLYAEVLQEITVQEGDTLWSIANYYLKDPRRWPDILKHNVLPSSDPNIVLPGMKLRVPLLLIKENLRAATLVQVVNDVRYRRQKEAAWNPALKDMKLYNEDGLRTLQQSIAQVQFPSGEFLKIDENSLVILRPEKTREEASLLTGGVRSSKTKILTSSTIIDPRIDTRGLLPDFKTRIKEDQTTLVEVFEGIVDVTAQGRTVTLTKGFGTEVKLKQPPSLPHILPPEPKVSQIMDTTIVAPSNKQQEPPKRIVSGSLEVKVNAPAPDTRVPSQSKIDRTPEVSSKNVTRYHLQISSSTNFHSVIVDKINPFSERLNIKFSDYQLADGIYYYRYAYVDDRDFEGRYTTSVEFTIKNTPPKLEIFPEKDSDRNDKFVHIEGKTELNATIRVDDKIIPVDENGRFIAAILPQKNIDVVTITAEDMAGNITKEELTIKDKKISQKHVKEKTEDKTMKKTSSFLSASMAVLTIVVILGVLVLIVK